MEVKKRDGSLEPVKFDKISNRIKKQTYGLSPDVDPLMVAQRVINGIYDGITSRQLDELAAETAATLADRHPDYSVLAARVAITALHKDTPKDFCEAAKALHAYVHDRTGLPAGMISDEVMAFIEKNRKRLTEAMVHDRDFGFDYFGYKTLAKSYLLKIDGRIAETPQQMYMRIACGIWCGDVAQAIETYDMLSTGVLSHATPTMFNAGTKRPQLSSCFLLDTQDSIEGIYKTITDTAKLSKNAGGIGISVSKVRAKGAYIKGTNGTSNGLLPMLKVLNETARYVDQCFASGTPIDTPKGPISISEIHPGDEVFCSAGIGIVEDVNSFVKETISVTTANGVFRVTPEHMLLVIVGGRQNKNAEAEFRAGLIKPEWKAAGHLSENDILLEYIPTYS